MKNWCPVQGVKEQERLTTNDAVHKVKELRDIEGPVDDK